MEGNCAVPKTPILDESLHSAWIAVLIEEHVLCKCCTSPVTLFLAARKQRLCISQSSGVFSRLERKDEYPDNVAIAIAKTESDTIALKFRILNIDECLLYIIYAIGHGYNS